VKNKPDFPSWKRENIDRFAAEAFDKMCEDADTIEQLRQDNKDLSWECRKLLTRDPASYSGKESKNGNSVPKPRDV
jgi:hypothetical protein